MTCPPGLSQEIETAGKAGFTDDAEVLAAGLEDLYRAVRVSREARLDEPLRRDAAPA